jgi:hypothetical protein
LTPATIGHEIYHQSDLLFSHREGCAAKYPRALKYLAFLAAVIAVYSVIFHLIMLHAESRYHSWITGIYWTLTVMTTLGFGDITFTSDIGRLFSIIVLLSGIILLLILLPFMFIRLFYAPWLEAQVRLKAPREAPEDTRGSSTGCAFMRFRTLSSNRTIPQRRACMETASP